MYISAKLFEEVTPKRPLNMLPPLNIILDRCRAHIAPL